jgi:hypothetical protein
MNTEQLGVNLVFIYSIKEYIIAFIYLQFTLQLRCVCCVKKETDVSVDEAVQLNMET